jgi:class 3 adenylate cyclase/SAM-dependent methyltransferase
VGFVPALGRLGTRFYDPIIRATTRERRFKERLLEIADLSAGDRLLDLGCGTGTLAIAAAKREPRAAIHGIDVDPTMIERARQKSQTADADVDLTTGSATQLPYGDDSFDVVFSSLLFHHLDRDSKEAAAREVGRVLTPEGRFLVADWGAPSDPLMRALFLTIRLVDGFETTADNFAGRLPEILRSGGFDEIVEFDHYRTLYGSLVLLEAAKASAGDVDAAEAITRLGERRYAWPELCRLAGVEHPVADRLWRALGFPDVPPDAPVYTADDVRALEIAAEGLDRLTGAERDEAIDLMVREAQSLSGHLGRIVEIQVDTLQDFGRLGLRRGAVAQALERGIEHSDLGWLLVYGLRRRLDEALRRRATGRDADRSELAIGFVDLVGFTEASARLEEDELGAILARFESLAWDVVTEAGGQVVKLIGDEAMFVCPSAAEAAGAALEIVGATSERNLPAARAGLAIGPVLARGGDYFGLPVNLASRLVDRADSGAVVVDERLREALNDRFTLEPMDSQRLKGIGTVPAWKLSLAPDQ